jgi:hypothetical protein
MKLGPLRIPQRGKFDGTGGRWICSPTWTMNCIPPPMMELAEGASKSQHPKNKNAILFSLSITKIKISSSRNVHNQYLTFVFQ